MKRKIYFVFFVLFNESCPNSQKINKDVGKSNINR